MANLFSDMPGVFKKAPHEVEPPPTSLWQHVKDKTWNETRKDLAASDATEMAKTWHENDLPLHLACRSHAPDDVIVGLVDAYPEAVRERSQKDRRLPLHLCVKNRGSHIAVGKILREYPEALDERVDDKSSINKDTMRSAMGTIGIQPRIKKMLNRSTDDWKVIIEWEKDQVDAKGKVSELQEELGATEARVERGEMHDKVLAKRIKTLTAKHEDYVKETDAKLDELTKAHEAFKKLQMTREKAQTTRNTQLQSAIDASAAREIVTKSNFDGYANDMLRMYKKTVEELTEIRKEVAELKSIDAARTAVMNFN